MFKAGKRATDRANITSSPVRKSKSTSTDPRAFISVQIGAHWFTAFIDPGSVCSYVDQKTGQHCLKQKWRVKDSGETAILADGSEVSLGKKLSGTITAANWKIEKEFLELPNPGILLGMDALSKLGLQMFINGINMIPKGGGKKNHACAIEGPVTMINLKKYYNRRWRNWAPEIGDKVLKKTQYRSDKAAGFNAKLAEKYDGPYTVKKKPSPVIVDLQDERGKYFRHVHIGNLKPYQEPIKRDNEEICTTLRPGTGNAANNPWQEGKQWRRGNTSTELTSTSRAE